MKTSFAGMAPRFSRTTPRRVALAGLLAIAWLALAACTRGPQISTQAAGHAVTARIEGNRTSVANGADGARLGSEFGQVMVERTRMRIEGASWVRIAEGVPVAVNIQHGHITLKAGGVSVGQSIKD